MPLSPCTIQLNLMCKLNSWSLEETISPAATTVCFSFYGFSAWEVSGAALQQGQEAAEGRNAFPFGGTGLPGSLGEKLMQLWLLER